MSSILRYIILRPKKRCFVVGDSRQLAGLHAPGAFAVVRAIARGVVILLAGPTDLRLALKHMR